MSEDNKDDRVLVMPFWIDTDGYDDRDRLMFCCGFEFGQVYEQLKAMATDSDDECVRVIHRENESRIRMMCGKLGFQCEISQHTGYDGCETWSELKAKRS